MDGSLRPISGWHQACEVMVTLLSLHEGKTMTTTTLHSTDPEQPALTMNPALTDKGLRTINVRRWAVLIAKVLLPGGLFAISLFGAFANPAQAQTINPNTFPATKLSVDLVGALNTSTGGVRRSRRLWRVHRMRRRLPRSNGSWTMPADAT